MIRQCIILILMVLTTESRAQQASNRQLYQTLDSLIEHYDQLTADKERRVAAIKEGVKGITLTAEQQYDLNQ
ncbi:MAG: hypothetical protein II860_09370, partial [Prevotella sp.]|nr:hypothetical protein [Prevotella sp.]